MKESLKEWSRREALAKRCLDLAEYHINMAHQRTEGPLRLTPGDSQIAQEWLYCFQILKGKEEDE